MIQKIRKLLDEAHPAEYLTTWVIITVVKHRMGSDHLNATFAALADPTRRAILARLSLGDTSVNEIAEPFGISLPAISRHLKVLEKAGLITRGKEAQWRPCKLNPSQLKAAADWLDNYRQFWEESFDRLDDYLQKLKVEREKGASKGKPHVRHRRAKS